MTNSEYNPSKPGMCVMSSRDAACWTTIMQDYAKPPESYTLINLFATYDAKLLNNNLSLTATIDNVLDTNYRDYLDRFRYYVDSPGINAGLRINYQIN